uniref:Orf152 n=1 Tax=Spizellomyces punctatus TaxID=109760 RepID=Q950Q9_SPIPN|nr:orf152 [Spizellomyces punctatus]AAK84249.1 orf152 [Spizellomyces punctatus]
MKGVPLKTVEFKDIEGDTPIEQGYQALLRLYRGSPIEYSYTQFRRYYGNAPLDFNPFAVTLHTVIGQLTGSLNNRLKIVDSESNWIDTIPLTVIHSSIVNSDIYKLRAQALYQSFNSEIQDYIKDLKTQQDPRVESYPVLTDLSSTELQALG